MSTTTKTLGAIAVTLLALVVYVGVFVLKLYFMFYAALGLTFVALATIVLLTAGGEVFHHPKK